MTYDDRDGFNTHEIHDVREVFKNVSETIPELGLKMIVDGKPLELNGKKVNFFRFNTKGYSINLKPMWVLHKKKEPACQVVIHNFVFHKEIMDYVIATRVRPVRNIFSLALSIIQNMEELASNEANS